MRTFVAISWLAILAPASLLAVGDTNEFTLFKHQARRQAYEWRISEARILATPEWSIGVTNIPVSPDRAWQIAKDWSSKQAHGEPDLVRMEIRWFDPSGTSKSLRKRFYYRIDCIPMQFDSMLVVILMDGTVVEPKLIPDLPPEEIK
jgi:hypothetical protein